MIRQQLLILIPLLLAGLGTIAWSVSQVSQSVSHRSTDQVIDQPLTFDLPPRSTP